MKVDYTTQKWERLGMGIVGGERIVMGIRMGEGYYFVTGDFFVITINIYNASNHRTSKP